MKKYLKENLTPEETIEYLKELQLERYKILPDGKIDVNENLYIFDYHLLDHGAIKVQFNEVTGAVDCGQCKLSTLEGFPRKVGKNFRCQELPNLKSLEGAPSEIGGSVKLSGVPITSLIGISDIFKKIGGEFRCDFDNIKEGGIGLLQIEGLKQLTSPRPLPQAFQIISKYLGRPHDIFDCQSELVDAGLDDFAQM